MKRILLPLLVLLLAPLSSGLQAADVRVVGFHLGSEFFILTEEVNSSDFQARQIIFVLHCSFREGQISGIDRKVTQVRIIPEGSTSGITYSSSDLRVLVTEIIDDRTCLVQVAVPYDVNVLGTKLEIKGKLGVILEEEEKQSRPIPLDLVPGTTIELESFPVLLSGVEIPKDSPFPIAITFRMTNESGSGRNYSVQFFDEKMRPVPAQRSDYVIDNIHEATYSLTRRPQDLNAVFKYVGVSKSETVDYSLAVNLDLTTN